VLPTQNRQQQPMMSSANFGRLLVRMGYKGKVVPHGFRTTISTILNEQHFHHDAIERQMHHKEADKVRDAYNRANYWPERVKMMQWWGDFLEHLKKVGQVI
jgi:integrase